jgi:hypothetical protein
MKRACVLIAASVCLVGGATVRADDVSSEWEESFPTRAAPAQVHFVASYRDGVGRMHQIEVWRESDLRLRRKTDEAIERKIGVGRVRISPDRSRAEDPVSRRSHVALSDRRVLGLGRACPRARHPPRQIPGHGSGTAIPGTDAGRLRLEAARDDDTGLDRERDLLVEPMGTAARDRHPKREGRLAITFFDRGGRDVCAWAGNLRARARRAARDRSGSGRGGIGLTGIVALGGPSRTWRALRRRHP